LELFPGGIVVMAWRMTTHLQLIPKIRKKAVLLSLHNTSFLCGIN
jgi:hypothetical protein